MHWTGHIPGGKPPRGTVTVSGAKNSATRLLAATLLSDQTSTLTEFPTQLVDVEHKIRFIRELGCTVEVDHAGDIVAVTPEQLITAGFDENDDFPIRTTYLLVAGQILRNGFARVPYPGGCRIGNRGSRGYDLHVMVWEALGCEVTETDVAIEVRGSSFRGGVIDFPISTTGGTENALLCAAVANGDTEIRNAYITPEVGDLIAFLRLMGARIDVIGNSSIRVQGVAMLEGARMPVMPDRIEALTWIVYALLSKGTLRIDRVPFESMAIPFIHIEKMGIDLLTGSDSVFVDSTSIKGDAIQPFELACGTYPGIISDMQPFFVLLGMQAAGKSRIYDYRYPERIAFVDELAKLCGPNSLEAESGKITTHGNSVFSSGRASSTDLRGSMAVVIAALCADGRSTIDDIQMALRGYNDLQGKLSLLGIEIDIDK